MNEHLTSIILASTGASELRELGVIQSLWSGYGSIVRYGLKGGARRSVVVKHVSLPESGQHPRGWNTDLSHERKLKSYQVETAWYGNWSPRCGADCRVPECIALESVGHEVVMVLEDLDASGFAQRRTSVNRTELEACLTWLANFHATFLGEGPQGLWESGTYWHLETRPDELAVLAKEDPLLKNAARAIDLKLKASPYQTLVHGDAKLANFCFSEDGGSVAAVDFQYVGAGCGMKDVAYFIGSCLDDAACAQQEPVLLDVYFEALRAALQRLGRAEDADALEADWRALYPVAWTDFHRFLKGWSPGHWKIHTYSERLAREVVAALEGDGVCN
jgi:aminoglycoside phosphotransferase (APT) family kinase protein